MIKFVVLSTQRSGSTLLKTCLDSHPDIQAYGELFQHFGSERSGMPNLPLRYQVSYQKYLEDSPVRKLADKLWQKSSIYKYLDNVYAKFADKKAVGFKLMYNHAKKYPDVLSWIQENDVKVIHLIRDNHLKTTVSLELARKRKIYSSTKPLEQTKVSLVPSVLKAQLESRQKLVQEYQSLFEKSPYLEISYETFVNYRKNETKRLLAFLDVEDTKDLNSDLSKTNSNSLEDLIENYEEVAAHLKGTRFEQFLC